MSEVIEFFTRINIFAADYPSWLFWCALVVVLILSELAKLPIKHFTGKIENENLRKKINAVIMLLPIGFGFLVSWILTYFGFGFSITAALVWGTTSQVIYEFVSRIFKRIKNGEAITANTIKSDLKDSVEVAETAEDKFNALVEQIKHDEATK